MALICKSVIGKTFCDDESFSVVTRRRPMVVDEFLTHVEPLRYPTPRATVTHVYGKAFVHTLSTREGGRRCLTPWPAPRCVRGSHVLQWAVTPDALRQSD